MIGISLINLLIWRPNLVYFDGSKLVKTFSYTTKGMTWSTLKYNHSQHVMLIVEYKQIFCNYIAFPFGVEFILTLYRV